MQYYLQNNNYFKMSKFVYKLKVLCVYFPYKLTQNQIYV